MFHAGDCKENTPWQSNATRLHLLNSLTTLWCTILWALRNEMRQRKEHGVKSPNYFVRDILVFSDNSMTTLRSNTRVASSVQVFLKTISATHLHWLIWHQHTVVIFLAVKLSNILIECWSPVEVWSSVYWYNSKGNVHFKEKRRFSSPEKSLQYTFRYCRMLRWKVWGPWSTMGLRVLRLMERGSMC